MYQTLSRTKHRWSRVIPLAILLLVSCEYESVGPQPDGGRTVTFVKQDGADPTLESNQDRITDNVWITRGNDGGQIYNARINTSANKQTSPEDTEWALGTLEELENLTFDTFRNTIQPQDVVGRNLVLHLITDDIYLNIRFTAWSASRLGGFAYIRDER